MKPKFKYGDLVSYWNGSRKIYGEIQHVLAVVYGDGEYHPLLRYSVDGAVVMEDRIKLECHAENREDRSSAK